MTECCDIKAVVVPSAAVGTVLLTGAAELVGDAILDLGLEMDYYQREIAQDGAGVTCVRVELADESPARVSSDIQAALASLLDATPELAGWTLSVSLGEGSGVDLEQPRPDDLDAEAERLLPSGDEIAGRLVRESQHEQSVYGAAVMFRAVPTEDLSTGHLDSLSATERAAALRRASALAGCLVHAADLLIDELIEDIVSLRAEENVADERGTASRIEDTWVLCQLPARFAANYTPLFAQRLLVAVVDVTGRLTKGWEPLASVAQELGLRVLLNLVEVVADTAGVALDDGSRGHLEDLLFEDIDHELLYNPAYDGIEDDPESQPPGMAPMRFEDWFEPFNDERTMPPYALPRALSDEHPTGKLLPWPAMGSEICGSENRAVSVGRRGSKGGMLRSGPIREAGRRPVTVRPTVG
jgi:hypothetical protein